MLIIMLQISNLFSLNEHQKILMSLIIIEYRYCSLINEIKIISLKYFN